MDKKAKYFYITHDVFLPTEVGDLLPLSACFWSPPLSHSEVCSTRGAAGETNLKWMAASQQSMQVAKAAPEVAVADYMSRRLQDG